MALEAENDSDSEFERILALRDLDDEEAIRISIGATQSNWDNAKKILPSIAEQIGDAAKSGDRLFYVGEQVAVDRLDPNRHGREEPRWGRARPTSAESIAAWRGSDESDEGGPLVGAPTSHGAQLRAERTERHNGIVRAFARSVIGAAALWEDPIDCLALVGGVALLAEVKTLDGSPSDETAPSENRRGTVALLRILLNAGRIDWWRFRGREIGGFRISTFRRAYRLAHLARHRSHMDGGGRFLDKSRHRRAAQRLC